MVLDHQQNTGEFEKESCASIWPGVTASVRHEKLQISGFRSIS